MKIIVIAPHPDDETLGCGGTLLKHKSDNHEINWLIMTAISELSNFSEDAKIKRKNGNNLFLPYINTTIG